MLDSFKDILDLYANGYLTPLETLERLKNLKEVKKEIKYQLEVKKNLDFLLKNQNDISEKTISETILFLDFIHK